MNNSSSYPLWTLTTQDCIVDLMETTDIVQLAQFQVLVGLSSIESLEIVDLTLDNIEGDKVYPLVQLDVVLGGMTFHITVTVESHELIHFVRHNIDPQAAEKVQAYFTD